MKKIKLVVIILAVLGFVYLIMPIEYSYLYAKSKDEKWVVYSFPAYKEGEWSGDMYYQGNSSGEIGNVNVNIKYNGKNNYYNGDVEPERHYKNISYIDKKIIKEQKDYIYSAWEFGGEYMPKVQLKITWKEGGKEKNTTMIMKKRKISRCRIMGTIWDE
ncbi:MAG: hypothetical protein PHT76_13250 [Anaerostipes sp.]|nr:hypothetical protein [Anaerostipes sp.]